MEELLEIRATQLPAEDVDFLRPHARASGYTNTGVGVLRFAVRELAQRLRREYGESTAENTPKPTEPGACGRPRSSQRRGKRGRH